MKEMKEKIEPETEADLLKDLRNSDEYLKEKAPGIIAERKRLGLEGLVGGLQAVIINTEPEKQRATAEELLRYTGLEFDGAFVDDEYRTCVLKTPDYHGFRSADFLIRSRIKGEGENPFYRLNMAPKSRHLPNTRLETFVFETKDIEGSRRLHPKISRVSVSHRRALSTWKTTPSFRRFHPSSQETLLVYRMGRRERALREPPGVAHFGWDMKKPKLDHLQNVRWLDHTATRVKAQDRDLADNRVHETYKLQLRLRHLCKTTKLHNQRSQAFSKGFCHGLHLRNIALHQR